MATEKLKFKIELGSEMWDKPPIAEVSVNGKTHYKKEITASVEEPIIIEFEDTLEEGKNYDLVINRSGKTDGQTVVNEKGDILKDQILHINKIEIDEIDIGALIFEGIYRPEYPEPWASQQTQQGIVLPDTIKNSPSMGHNGTWTFSFTSPFYMWLLENLY